MSEVSIEELKSRVSIVDVINDYVALKKAGGSYKGICPFHDDKNPSMHVSEDKGLFYCFSCKTGGDVFGFLQKINGSTFSEALREVAGKAGVKLEAPGPGGTEKEAMFEMNRAVCGFFRKSLADGSPESANALSYLKSRGISAGLAEQFSIGYAPSAPGAVGNFLKNAGFKEKHAFETGLITADEDGKKYCKFRSRIMFPIIAPDSRIMGFGGRVIEQSNSPQRAPKYLNSSESPVYRKRSSLYGLDRTRQEIKKRGSAVLVEGYMDLLSVFRAGVKNVAASLGTSLTKGQVALLRRYADEIVILYDGDRAGIDASFSAGEVFMASGIVPRVARVPDGLDPDTFAKEKGPEALGSLIQNAPPLTEVLMDDLHRSVAAGRISPAGAAKRLVSVVPAMAESPEVGPYIREASRRFGFREQDLYSLVSSIKTGFSGSVETNSSLDEQPQAGSAEMMLLRIVLKFPQMADFIAEERIMEHVPDGEVKRAISSIAASGLADLPSNPGGFVSHAYFTLDAIQFMDEDSAPVEIEKCLAKLKLDSLGRELKSVRESLRVLESRSPGDERIKTLMRRAKDLIEEKKRIERGETEVAGVWS